MGWDGQGVSLVEQRFCEFAEDLHYLCSLLERRSLMEQEERNPVDPGMLETMDFLESEIRRYKIRVSPVEKLLDCLDGSDPELAGFFRLRYVEKRKRDYIKSEMGLSDRLQRDMRRSLLRKGARFIGAPFLQKKIVRGRSADPFGAMV